MLYVSLTDMFDMAILKSLNFCLICQAHFLLTIGWCIVLGFPGFCCGQDDGLAYRWAGIQMGSDSSRNDEARGLAYDESSDSVVIAGCSFGALYGTHKGPNDEPDLVVAKFSAKTGSKLWAVQEGTVDGYDSGNCVAVNAGDVFIGGHSGGSLYGTNAGSNDIIAAKFDKAGTRLWGIQKGSAEGDSVNGIAVDTSSNVFITGYTGGSLYGASAGNLDSFVAMLIGETGMTQWGVQAQISGSAFEMAQSIAWDSSTNVLYVSGHTYGSLFGTPNAGSADIFLVKLDALSGALLWGLQSGTSLYEDVRSVAVDSSSNVFICGITLGSLYGIQKGGGDFFLAKFDDTKTKIWGFQDGTPGEDIASSLVVTTDLPPNLYVAGATKGSLHNTNAGEHDVYVSMYQEDPDGSRVSLVWGVQEGTTSMEEFKGVSVGLNSSVYASGHTSGSLYGTNAGIKDIAVAHIGNCRAGHYESRRRIGSGSIIGTACSVCPTGTYSGMLVAVSETACLACPAGTRSAPGSSACTHLTGCPETESTDFVISQHGIEYMRISAQSGTTQIYGPLQFRDLQSPNAVTTQCSLVSRGTQR